MELGLSLGDTVPKPLSFLHEEKTQKIIEKDLGFCMAVGKMSSDGDENNGKSKETGLFDSSDPPAVQLDLLPFSQRAYKSQPSSNKSPFNWLTENCPFLCDSTVIAEPGREMLKVNRSRVADEEFRSNRVSTTTFKMDLRGKTRDFESNNYEGTYSSRGISDEEEENGISRKKLRLTKQQSAFLEDSFKQHSTLNPKQKLGIAKQLNLRPRQVEVWFQNRRARTKLKQTEVDCEYLKRYSETLTEENRRLQKELQELRALKASKPFSPPTTLTMCPSCERVATTAAAPPATVASAKLMPKTEVSV